MKRNLIKYMKIIFSNATGKMGKTFLINILLPAKFRFEKRCIVFYRYVFVLVFTHTHTHTHIQSRMKSFD